MILDLFSYVTFKMEESKSASVTCSSFTVEDLTIQRFFWISPWKNVTTNWLSSCDTAHGLGIAVFKALFFFLD